MSHHTIKAGYSELVERLNRFPQGAPPSELLYKILELLFNPQEAELVSQLPIRPFNVDKAANIWKKNLAESQKILDELSSRAILLDIAGKDGKSIYVLPPPMAGFFEFSLMRVGGNIDQKVLSELYYQYLTVEEDFIKALFCDGETQLGRVFVNEPVLSSENALHVLDYERASRVIQSSKYMGVGTCYCRHKMQHLGKNCDAPLDICMTFGGTAESLTKYGYARRIDKVEGMDLLQEAYDHNLVQFGENVQKHVSFICNCCGCCCEALLAAQRFGFMNPVHTTNFIPVVHDADCSGCGKCIKACPVKALESVSANDPARPKKIKPQLLKEICLGCGVCVRACPSNGLTLESRPERVITPLNSTHRVVMMAIERGKFQELLFDNKALMSHRVMAAILGVVLKLPPVKKAMVSKQVKSRYLERLLRA